MDILDDKGVSKLSAKVFFFKVNYCFKHEASDYPVAGIKGKWKAFRKDFKMYSLFSILK